MFLPCVTQNPVFVTQNTNASVTQNTKDIHRDKSMPKDTKLIQAARKLTESRRAAPMQMPLWSDEQRGIPNPFARSALFTAAGQKESRTELRRQKITSVNGFDLFYTGEELRQDDEDVFLQVVHLARMHSPEDCLETNGNQLLDALQWGKSSKDYERLKDCLLRLKEATVTVTTSTGKTGFAGNLLRKVAWQQDDSASTRTNWVIYLEREIIGLFASDGYTLIDWEQRLSLPPLAKWLHSFYFTHREPFPYKVETLYGLCGSKCRELRAFRYLLKKALGKLVESGFLTEWSITPDTDTVIVVRHRRLPG